MHLIPTGAMKDSDISIEPELKLEIAVSIFSRLSIVAMKKYQSW